MDAMQEAHASSKAKQSAGGGGTPLKKRLCCMLADARLLGGASQCSNGSQPGNDAPHGNIFVSQ
jgi:hypothetical protein